MRYWQLIEKKGFDFSQAGRALKGREKEKYLYWLYDATFPISTSAKQVRLTPHGIRVQEYLQSPYKVDSVVERYKMQLDVTEDYASVEMRMPDLSPEELQERETERLKNRRDTLQIPSDYGSTNEMEDFAESFVAFMDAPEQLSDLARYRMQRALSLSGLYGKTVMRLSRTVATKFTSHS
jgi:hypothetical protein